jgi:pimeloyl-ACP methyl ester carboxylesterase
VPAFVSLVKHRTGAAQVVWVGHSMGGIVALAHLARYQNPGIDRLVTVGSQLTMPQGQIPAQFVRELIATRQQQVTGALRGQELVSRSGTTVHNLFFNEKNVAPTVYEALTTWATDVPSVGLMRQYLMLAGRGMLYDASGRFCYAQAAGNVKVPVLLTCGAVDRFAPLQMQQFLYDHVLSTDKTLPVPGIEDRKCPRAEPSRSSPPDRLSALGT